MDHLKTAGTKPNIVIIDDAPPNLQFLSEIFPAKDYRCRIFPGGKLALASIKKNPPDLILLDITMPEMNGYELCSRFKADPLLKDIPVIFISCLNKPVDKLKAFEAGAVDYIARPFHFMEIQSRVRLHLGLYLRLRRLEQENSALRETSAELRQLQKAHEEMLHVLVHDLHQPMTGVMVYLDLMELQEETRLSEASQQSIAKIRASGQQLIGMINSILDVNKMKTNVLQIACVSCDPIALVKEAMIRMEPLKGNRRVELVMRGGLSNLDVDPALIIRVVENLLANAIKFSPENAAVIIKMELAKPDLRITVLDHGPGIPMALQPGFFEKFCQAGDDRSTGMGFGLYFCKMAVEAHGGKIGMDEGEKDKGCAMWFTLPLS
jgi:two-component system sensor histidine kinase/response regulator